MATFEKSDFLAANIQLGATGYWSIANYIGQGFDVYGKYDMSSTTGLLFNYPDATAHEFILQGKSFLLPASVLGVEDGTSYFKEASGSTRETYQDSLATEANVEVGIGAFSGDVKASFARQYTSASDSSFLRITAITQLGHLDLRTDQTDLTAPLARAIASLPDHVDPANLQPFADFFEQYGVYYVWRIILGGSLQMLIAVDNSSKLTSQDISVEAHASYASLFKVGAKVETSQKHENFEKSSSTTIQTSGGDVGLAASLVALDPGSASATTVKLFTDWVSSVASAPAAVDFRLKPIWELCGDKRGAVMTAWRLYSQVMHPKLTIQTYGYVGSHTTPPIVTLGRQLKPDASLPPVAAGGWQIIILDRSNVLGDDGVRFNRYYSFDPANHHDIPAVYDAMYRDIVGSGFATAANLLIAVSFGIQINWGPTGDFYGLLSACGGSARNLGFVKPWDIGSGNNTFSDYILVGAFDSGTGSGVDYASGNGWTAQGEPVLRNPTMQVLFYRDQRDAPYTFALASVT
jgi:hypothetical protein